MYKNLTPERIHAMNFSEIVAAVNEPNTPSGGTDTIVTILSNLKLNPDDRILDVGCNTGFATIQLHQGSGLEVVGVDINPRSLDFAQQKAASLGLSKVNFVGANATRMPFPSESFQVIYCNNVTSFIQDRAATIAEYHRLLAPDGYLVVVPIFYHTPPPAELLKQVEEAVGTTIPVRGKQYWYDQFGTNGTRLIFDRDFGYIFQSDDRIAKYTDEVLQQGFLLEYPQEIREALRSRLRYFYELFNNNLQFARFSIMIYQKNAASSGRARELKLLPLEHEPILFQTRPL